MAIKYVVRSIINDEKRGIGMRLKSIVDAMEYIEEGFRIHPDFKFQIEKIEVDDKPESDDE